ncbi:23S rRNA (adenine(2503)-C(2))-methyltransferase RlmN [candidate division BRC1 bacterium HGW-BRC1-1]|nr:MAG: 23S rRNA (adenine(2503)-C(2))-methyltransferase RlmN [candidate division BRC1 bacterium HGW-BRC1-1]
MIDSADQQMPPPNRPILVGMDSGELQALAKDAGFPSFRGKQLHHWLYNKAAISLDEMKNLPAGFRDWLREHCELGHDSIASIRESSDGSKKILYELSDGKIVESVLMPERDWFTMCISSQVGCAVGCTFCMTGFGGFQRQMTRAEILSQVLLSRKLVHGEFPRNLVFMGMGEPMLNLDEVIPALNVLTEPDGIGMTPRRITVSTAGILPGIERLGEADLGVNVAISLNAADDRTRNEIMPINHRYPIASLLDACRRFPLQARRRVTFEYVLLNGVNDSPEDAWRLSQILRWMPCKINLIPWNPDPHLPFRRPEESSVRRFQEVLLSENHSVSVRYSKGLDVGAACGQLAGHWRGQSKGDEV